MPPEAQNSLPNHLPSPRLGLSSRRLQVEGRRSTGIPPWEAVAFDAWIRANPGLSTLPRSVQEAEYRDQHSEDEAAWSAAERQIVFPVNALLYGFVLPRLRHWMRLVC